MRNMPIQKHAIAMLTTRLVGVVLFAALLCVVPFQSALAQTAPNLGTAGNFAVVFGPTGALTCTGAVINGDVACYIGGSVGACTITGVTNNGDAIGNAAYSDFLTAYGAVSGVSCGTILNGTLAGQTLLPGVYCLDNSAKTGVLNLNGPPNGVWIFKTEASAFTATNFQVVFTDGSGACDNGARVFWWSSSGVTVTNTAENFMGTILAGSSATLTGGNFNGQIFATVSVTLTTPASFNACIPAVVCPTLALAPATLPDAHVGSFYSQTIAASGGTGPYTYSVTTGSLPTDLTLDPNSGLLSGFPTTVGVTTFSITATDTATACVITSNYTLTVAEPCPTVLLAPATLPAPTVDVPYSQTLMVTGGTAPYTYAVTAGSLPTGLTLSSAGLLSGTITSTGSFSFTITATDAVGCAVSLSYGTAVGAYDLTFYDDFIRLQVRTQLCLNSATGAYTFNLFSTEYLTSYTGSATITVDDLGRWIILGTGPDYMSSIYSPRQHTATAVLKPASKILKESMPTGSAGLWPIRPPNKRDIPTYHLSDDNTLDNPPCGERGTESILTTPSNGLTVRR